jgi:hypothetical protein
VQPRREHEVPLKQRSRSAEFVEHLILIHGLDVALERAGENT